MADVTGWQILDVVNGGSANGGQDVFMKLRVNDGSKDFDTNWFVENSQIPIIVMKLQHAAGMARKTRLAQNPAAEADGSVAGGYAPSFAGAFVGDSISADGTTVLTLQIDAGGGTLMNSHFALSFDQLKQLSATIRKGISEIQKTRRSSSRKKKLH